MTVWIWILTVLSALEFVFAPLNLWTGRTMPNFVRFTGLSPATGTRVVAPVKLLTAITLVAGLAVPIVGLAGAALAMVICCLYLVALASPKRRYADGIAAFALFGSVAGALLILRLTTLA